MEVLSRRKLLLVGGSLLIPGCREFVAARNSVFGKHPVVEAEDLATSTTEPQPAKENVVPPTAVPSTPTESLEIAMLKAEATVNAGKLLKAEATLQARDTRSTNPSVSLTALPRSTATPIPPTTTRIPPTATRAIILSPTPNPEQLLIEDAKKATLNRWYEMMSFTVGEQQYKNNPQGDGIVNRPFMNTPYYPTFMSYEIAQRLFPPTDPKSEQTVPETPLPNFMRVKWHIQTVLRPYPTSSHSDQRADTKGETEMRDVRLELSHRKSLTAADRANGIEWESSARIDYTGRYRAASFLHKNRLADSGSPTHPFPEGKWTDSQFSFEIKRTRGRWDTSPLLHLQQVVTPVFGVRESLYIFRDIRSGCTPALLSGSGCKIQFPLG